MSRFQVITVIAVCGLPLPGVLAQPCGTPWSQGPASGPSARRYHAVAYDSDRAKVVLFGGLAGSTDLGDTWEWTAAGPGGGGSWALRATAGPSPRDHCGLAYDPVRHRTVLFGGAGSGGFSNQTWEWDGIAWTLAQPAASPPAMDATLMAYDAGRQRIVMVSTNSGGGVNKTWQYDGATWTSFTDSTPIATPGYSSMAYDAARSRMVLTTLYFGGLFASSPYVWERDSTTGWVGREWGTLPVTSTGNAMTYDPVRGQAIFLDSQAFSGKTSIWTWNGTAWSVASTDGPPLAEGRPPVFDAAGGQLLLFGGRSVGGAQDLADTWLCRSDSRSGPVLSNLGRRAMYLRLGGPAGTLSVGATGSGTIAYQWRLNGQELFDGGPFSGVHTPTLTVSPTDVVYAGDYDAIVTDDCGPAFRPATRVTVTCYANCTNGTVMPVLTAEDFQCFLNNYAAGCLDPENCYANCDRSTAAPFLNVNDFLCFLNQFNIGCP